MNVTRTLPNESFRCVKENSISYCGSRDVPGESVGVDAIVDERLDLADALDRLQRVLDEVQELLRGTADDLGEQVVAARGEHHVDDLRQAPDHVGHPPYVP